MVTGDAGERRRAPRAAGRTRPVLVADRTARAARGFRFARARAARAPWQGREPSRGACSSASDVDGRARRPRAARADGRARPRARAPHDRVRARRGRAATASRHDLRRAGRRQEPPDVASSSRSGRSVPGARPCSFGPLPPLRLRRHVLAAGRDPEGPSRAFSTPTRRRRSPPETIRDVDADVEADATSRSIRDGAAAALAYTLGRRRSAPVRFARRSSRRQVRHRDARRLAIVLLGAGRRSPRVAVIEDIHWADEALLDLLEERRRPGRRRRCCFVCPSRPELTDRRPAWGGGRRSSRAIVLDPLAADDAERLVGTCCSASTTFRVTSAARILAAGGRQPLLPRGDRPAPDRRGTIVRADGDRWRATAADREVDIPDTVQGVLAARIDLLAAAGQAGAPARGRRRSRVLDRAVGALLNGDRDRLDEALERLGGARPRPRARRTRRSPASASSSSSTS